MPYLVPQQLGIHPSLQEGPENLSALCHHYSLQSCLGMSFIQFFSHLPHCRCQQEQPISWTHSHGQTAAVSEPSLTQHPSPFGTAQKISQPSTTTTAHSPALVHLSSNFSHTCLIVGAGRSKLYHGHDPMARQLLYLDP